MPLVFATFAATGRASAVRATSDAPLEIRVQNNVIPPTRVVGSP